ncbi:MAG: SGNH/GDSL hydrolase family protein [Ketobacter sp.]
MSIKNSMDFCKLAVLSASAVFAFNASAIDIGGGSGGSTTKMIVGDSIFALSGDIHSFLEDSLNENIDTHARSGCQMNGGNILCSSRYAVPSQYDRASKSGIETVIMNGGGNDFLLGDGADCGTGPTPACQEVLFAVEETMAGLVEDMHADGIDEIVYLGYYSTTASSGNNALNDFSMEYKIANYPAMGVKFIDSRDAFRGNERSYITLDGIHPTAAGSRVLADLIEQAL